MSSPDFKLIYLAHSCLVFAFHNVCVIGLYWLKYLQKVDYWKTWGKTFQRKHEMSPSGCICSHIQCRNSQIGLRPFGWSLNSTTQTCLSVTPAKNWKHIWLTGLSCDQLRRIEKKRQISSNKLLWACRSPDWGWRWFFPRGFTLQDVVCVPRLPPSPSPASCAPSPRSCPWWGVPAHGGNRFKTIHQSPLPN